MCILLNNGQGRVELSYSKHIGLQNSERWKKFGHHKRMKRRRKIRCPIYKELCYTLTKDKDSSPDGDYCELPFFKDMIQITHGTYIRW